MPSGGYRRLTAFILWPFPLSKKSPLDPPSPWSWLGAYDTLDYGLFEKLSRDKEIAVRSCIAYNRKTPLTILKKMYPDTVNEINETLQENILKKEKIEKN